MLPALGRRLLQTSPFATTAITTAITAGNRQLLQTRSAARWKSLPVGFSASSGTGSRPQSPRLLSSCSGARVATELSCTSITNNVVSRRPFHHGRASMSRKYLDPYEQLRHAKPLVRADSFSRVTRNPIVLVGFVALSGGVVVFYYSNREIVPVSGRTRFNCYSHESLRKDGELQFLRVMHDLEAQGVHILPEWDSRARRVNKVMDKLIRFSGMADQTWDIYVVDSPNDANAMVLPGGKVFVNTGILPVARNDSGLAAVLSHEIAHVLANHHGERKSAAIGLEALLYTISLSIAAFLGDVNMLSFAVTKKALDLAFALPMNRTQETEADLIGLLMMSQACFDPKEAVAFWQRMHAAQGNAEGPHWLSTHPSSQVRMTNMQEQLPRAIEKRSESDCQSTEAFADRFRRAMEQGLPSVRT